MVDALDTVARFTVNSVSVPTANPGGISAARVADLILATIALLFLAPLMVAIAVGIWVEDGGPALYFQARIGRGGRMFRCLKFRSMAIHAEARLKILLATDPAARCEWDRDHKLKCDPRITRLGSFLRKSSLDEIPQLINVLRGEMTLVGPRPIVVSEVWRYRRYFKEYCSVRPGITGLWQVNGRNDVSYRRRVALDVAFSRSYSFKVYIAILIATVPAVLLRKGSY